MIKNKEITVNKIRYSNEETGFKIVEIDNHEQFKSKVMKGVLPVLQQGDKLVVSGEEVLDKDRIYGYTLEVTDFGLVKPRTLFELRNFLIKHLKLSKLLAGKIIETYGIETLDALKNIESIIEAGIQKKKAIELNKRYLRHIEFESILILLMNEGFSTSSIHILYEKYRNSTIDKIKNNFWELEIDFKELLDVSKKKNREINSKFYHRFFVEILKDSEKDGHMFLKHEELLTRTLNYIKRNKLESLNITETEHDLNNKIHFYMKELIDAKLIKTEYIDKELSYFLTYNYYTELNISNHIKEIIKRDSQVFADTSIYGLEGKQLEALKSALKHSLMVLNGGPGTGKTYTTDKIIKVLESAGYKEFSLIAPTGKAAKRLQESTGKECITIHRLLGLGHISNKVEETKNILSEVVIVDEFSMVDAYLLKELLESANNPIAPVYKFIFIGDYNQLPSIGAGQVFKDMIESGIVPTVTLDKVKRQDELSPISVNAEKVIKGDYQNFDISNKNNELYFIQTKTNAKSIEGVLKSIERLNITKRYDLKDIQVLVSTREQARIVNNEIQDRYNKLKNNQEEVLIYGIRYREGDKVLQTINNYELEVFNGENGLIIDIYKNSDEEQVVVVLFNNREVIYTGYEEISQLDLAYAITIHKSQGSEYKCVLIVLDNHNEYMNNQNLLYTAITRAKEMVSIISDKDILFNTIKKEVPKRNTILKELLK